MDLDDVEPGACAATKIARDLLASTTQLSGWAARHHTAVAAARAAYDATASGR